MSLKAAMARIMHVLRHQLLRRMRAHVLLVIKQITQGFIVVVNAIRIVGRVRHRLSVRQAHVMPVIRRRRLPRMKLPVLVVLNSEQWKTVSVFLKIVRLLTVKSMSKIGQGAVLNVQRGVYLIPI